MLDERIRRLIETELSQAQKARSEGFEGRARVCARRAAGAAARVYLEMSGIPIQNSSAYDLIKIMAGQTNLPDEIQLALSHLLARVNEEFQLPETVDLISETRQLVNYIAKDN